jgi:membrane protein DedA with SNARE-associated domain
MGAASIPMRTFILGTFLGSLVYCAIFLILGEVLGAQYRAPLNWLDSHLGTGAFLLVAGIVVLLLVIHHFWGRLARYRLAVHYRHHLAKSSAAMAAAATQTQP